MTKEQFKTSTKVVRLWTHECERVFRDRLVNEHDLGKYDDMLAATLKNWFKEENLAEVQAAPNLFTAFMEVGADEDPIYTQVRAVLAYCSACACANAAAAEVRRIACGGFADFPELHPQMRKTTACAQVLHKQIHTRVWLCFTKSETPCVTVAAACRRRGTIS